MDGYLAYEKVPKEIVGICTMNAVLHTEGVACMVNTPGISMGKDPEETKGVKIQEGKEGLDLDVYCNVTFGAKIPQTAWNIQENVKKKLEDLTDEKIHKVNIHIMGVSFDAADAKIGEDS